MLEVIYKAPAGLWEALTEVGDVVRGYSLDGIPYSTEVDYEAENGFVITTFGYTEDEFIQIKAENVAPCYNGLLVDLKKQYNADLTKLKPTIYYDFEEIVVFKNSFRPVTQELEYEEFY